MLPLRLAGPAEAPGLSADGAGVGGRRTCSLFLEGCSRNLRTQRSLLVYWQDVTMLYT